MDKSPVRTKRFIPIPIIFGIVGIILLFVRWWVEAKGIMTKDNADILLYIAIAIFALSVVAGLVYWFWPWIRERFCGVGKTRQPQSITRQDAKIIDDSSSDINVGGMWYDPGLIPPMPKASPNSKLQNKRRHKKELNELKRDFGKVRLSAEHITKRLKAKVEITADVVSTAKNNYKGLIDKLDDENLEVQDKYKEEVGLLQARLNRGMELLVECFDNHNFSEFKGELKTNSKSISNRILSIILDWEQPVFYIQD
jgi:hypothetical protein